MREIFFSSDQHYNHFKTIEFCKRPFQTIEEMNEELIKKHNEIIKRDDTLYCLGDFGFYSIQELRKIRYRLNGKIVLIYGSHDIRNKIHKQTDMFSEISEYMYRKINGKNFALFHYPIYEWSGYFNGTIHLYGHIHNSENQLKIKGALNVGVDCHDFYPWHFDEVIAAIDRQGDDYMRHKSSMIAKIGSE